MTNRSNRNQGCPETAVSKLPTPADQFEYLLADRDRAFLEGQKQLAETIYRLGHAEGRLDEQARRRAEENLSKWQALQKQIESIGTWRWLSGWSGLIALVALSIMALVMWKATFLWAGIGCFSLAFGGNMVLGQRLLRLSNEQSRIPTMPVAQQRQLSAPHSGPGYHR